MKIKTFAKSDLNLKDWFVWEKSDSKLVKPIGGDTSLNHKSQISGFHTPQNAKAKKVLEMNIEVIERIVKEQAMRMTHIHFSNVPPPHPNFYDVRDSYKMKIININKI